ncbi:MAG: hypothetical protein ACX93N_03015 [Pseudohaliea sp.]
MAQPLDPLTPLVPPRPPLRHRVPGQGRPPRERPEDRGQEDHGDKEGKEGKEDQEEQQPPGGIGTGDRAGYPDSPGKERPGDDEHLIDDWA